MTQNLPVSVADVPHWRVIIRPDLYRPERIKTLAECKNIIENTSVKLRGWHYPYVSSKLAERGHGLDWVASWTGDNGHLEYWRFYQSGQFLHLFSIRELNDPRWQAVLKSRVLKHGSPELVEKAESAKGFISIENFIYRMTEIFEFAARLATQEIYKGSMYVEVELKGVAGFALSSDSRDAWNRCCAAADSELGQTWKIDCRDIISNSPHYARKACAWFFERFGWLPPAPEIIKREQEIFLSRSL